MKQISGNCILPFALWGEDPPDHLITSIEIIDDSFIVSGDRLGHLVVWKVNSDNKIIPIWYLLGHSGPICTLSRSMISLCNDRYIISVTINREMGVWNCFDGRCVRLERHLSVDHKFVKGYQMSNSNIGLLVCCGHYSGIQVLDSLTLVVLIYLQSRAHPDWIKSLCVFEHKQAGMHVVLGLSISGAITMWTIESMDVPQESKVIYETESKMLLLSCPISISICPNKPRLVMVLANTTMQIYDAATWTLLSECQSQKSCFLSGWFLNFETVILLQKKSQPRVYMVPLNCGDGLKDVSDVLPICSLNTGDSEVACKAVMVSGSRFLAAVGSGRGCVYWWNMSMDQFKSMSSGTVDSTDEAVLSSCWSQLNMASLTRPFRKQYSISCCHCEASTNTLLMGTSCGEILIMDLLPSLVVALFHDDSTHLLYHVLVGHRNAVRALQYAKTTFDKDTVKRWLWSGGEDFSVRLWSLDSRTCVSVFHCHSGPVTSFLTGPPLGLTKGKNDGHIVAPRRTHAPSDSPEQEVLRPINYSTWFGHRLHVSLDDDNGVAFLSLEARKVVLRVSLFSPLETIGWRRDQISVVLKCLDGSVTVWDLCAGHLERHEVGQLSEDIIDSSSDHIKLSCHPPLLLRISHLKDRIKHAALPPMQVHPVNLGHGVSSQILFCDTESLLVDIHRHLSNQKSCSESLLQVQFLLSLINQWQCDPCLDSTLESTIGLMRPLRRVCYGHMNIKFKTLSLPLQEGDNPVGRSVALLAGVSLCHAINNLPESQHQNTWPRLSRFLDNKSSLSRGLSADNQTEVRQVCCLFATSMATANLPQILCGDSAVTFEMAQIPIIIQTFLQKYHDRCLEIREAARTLLHAALDCLSSEQRHELVQFWASHGRIVSKPNNDSPEHHKYPEDESRGRRSTSSIFEAPSVCDWRYWSRIFDGGIPPEIEQLQATALSFLGIVGCRYGSPDLHLSPASNVISASVLRARPLDKAIGGFGLDDYRLARATCGYLMSLLTRPTATVTAEGKTGSHWSSMRCLAITLLGQGFPVWEPYLDVSTLFNKLLEIVAPAEKILSGWRQGQLLTDEMDAVRSARASLLVIALARPKVFATALSIEVLRHQTQSSSSPGSAVAATNGMASGRSGPTAGTAQSQPPLLAARHEVIEVIRVLCERKTREMHEVLPEIMDILLACLSKLDLRQYDLQQLFPPIILFRIASSHTASGKVCVGTKMGHVAFYDVKVGKYNTSPGHGGPVTSVSFSPDGKQMASYSMPDNSVCIWQLFSSGLFGMGSSHQVKLASRLAVPPVAVSHMVAEEDSSQLLWLEWSENKSIHLVTSSGLINKIKL